MTEHEGYMKRCLALAQLGAGYVSPNPMVGCVVVWNHQIIGESWHQRYGGAHAEVNAIRAVENLDLLKTATLYVSLEPCHHYGKTPPCVDLILAHQIPKVVIGSVDPNPLVAGKSIDKLKNAGVEVIVGVLQKEENALNKGFICQQVKHRPYIILKWAESKDGFFAPLKGQKWLSNALSKRLTHKWRNTLDAILVGKNTVIQDNPQLTDRFWAGNQPLRIVIDRALEIDKTKHIFTDEFPTIVLNSKQNGIEGRIQFIQLDAENFNVENFINVFYQLNINTLLVEGGAYTLNQFIECGFWDEAYIYKTDVSLNEGIDSPMITAYSRKLKQILANNILEIYYNE
jgi:diaminohydroxyphosphoribosylaminopyrimidine deaminase/5-amino-6-(5-phosphoribosylamino)uracil reductase